MLRPPGPHKGAAQAAVYQRSLNIYKRDTTHLDFTLPRPRLPGLARYTQIRQPALPASFAIRFESIFLVEQPLHLQAVHHRPADRPGGDRVQVGAEHALGAPCRNRRGERLTTTLIKSGGDPAQAR